MIPKRTGRFQARAVEFTENKNPRVLLEKCRALEHSQGDSKNPILQLAYQIEMGSHEHGQGCCLFRDQCTSERQVKRFLGTKTAHITKMWCTDYANFAGYCNKTKESAKIHDDEVRLHAKEDGKPVNPKFIWEGKGFRVEGTEPVYWGVMPAAGRSFQGKRNDLLSVKAWIDEHPTAAQLDLFENNFQQTIMYGRNLMKYRFLKMKKAVQNKYIPNLEVIVVWGETRAGKNRWIFEREDRTDVYKIPMKQGDSVWFDGYDGESCLLFEEFHGQIRTAKMQKLLDHFQIMVPVKGDHVWSNWNTIYITSNTAPKDWYHGWENIPYSVEESFMERITWEKHMIRPKNLKKPTWIKKSPPPKSALKCPSSAAVLPRALRSKKQHSSFVEKLPDLYTKPTKMIVKKGLGRTRNVPFMFRKSG